MALHFPTPLSRIAAATAALATFLVLAGATYQGVATALERRRFPRPGGLVDVGGHQLHIYCTGEGAPTVVLEAAAGSMSAAWGWIQPEIAALTRVCSYDRAGLGWSEAGDGYYVPSRVPGELHALLDEAAEQGPFLLVGHELGAAFARLFAARYRDEVAALVLVDDPATEPVAQAAMVGAWPWLARAGILRATHRLSAQAIGLPGDAGGAMQAFLNRPDHLTRAAMEISRFGEVEAAARALGREPAVSASFVAVDGSAQPAMIVTREDAARVLRAVEATVARLRADGTSSSPER